MGKKGYTTFQWAIIVIGAILCFLPKYFISFEGLSVSGVQVLFILIGGLLIWQCVGVDWSSLLVIFAMCFIPEMGPKTAFSSSMGNTTMIYLMLCFMLAASLQKTGVADRLAKWFITNKFSRKGPWYLVAMMFIAIFVLASGLSSSSTMLIFLPIFYGIFSVLGYKKEDKAAFPAIMVVSLIVVSQIAQATTPISHAMTLIGMSTYNNYTGEVMDFAQYVGVCLPVGLVVFVLWFLVIKYVLKMDVSRLANIDYDALNKDSKPITKQEKIAAALYVICIILWVLPGVSKYVFPALAPIFSKIDQCYPPLVAVLLLPFIRVDGEPVLPYKEGLAAVPWTTYMFGGTLLTLGSAIANADIGLQVWIADVFGKIVENMSAGLFVVIMIILAVILTNFLSNAVTIAICFAVAMPLVTTVFAGQISPIVIAILITTGASYAFATAPATPPAAIIADSGWVESGKMLKYGMIAAVIAVVCIATIGQALAGVLC